MINLDNAASGLASQNCRTNLPTQRVEIVPVDQVADCQQTGPISPSKRTVGLTVRNFIVGACGVLEIEIDNGVTGSSDVKLPFGGPANLSNASVVAPAYDWDAFTKATFTSKVKGDAPNLTVLGVVNGGAAWNQFINQFFSGGESVFTTKLGIKRVPEGSAILDAAVTPFYVGVTEQYAIDKAASFYSVTTSTNGSSTFDIRWNFEGCAGGGIPLSQTTGFEIEIPGGYEGTLILCIDAVESNIDYAEGC